MTIALRLSYLGTAYHGWQRQKNGLTVQELLETAIEKTCSRRVSLHGCGRTDSGVHAETYVASVRMDCSIPMDKLPFALNARLPADIVIHEAKIVPEDFHARFSCVSKEYTYRIHNAATRNPFLNDRAYFYPQELDVERMQEGAVHFVGRHDFSAVRALGTPVRSPVRTIHYLELQRQGDMISMSVCADGFLYNMVRAIAGTLIYVGAGKLAPEDIPIILSAGEREAAGPTVPACGLYLTDIDYNMECLWTSKRKAKAK